MIKKVGKVYWLDLWIGKKRYLRSLRTENELEALEKANQAKEELIRKHGKNQLAFEDFCNKYLKYAWQEKSASEKLEGWRFEKIKDFFKKDEIVFLSDLKPFPKASTLPGQL